MINKKLLSTKNFDKMRTMKSVECFDFHCEYCNSDDIKMIPTNVSIKPKGLDNSDIKDIKIRKELDSFKSIQKALKESPLNNLIYVCNSCNICSTLKKNVDEIDMSTWIRRHYGNADLCLSI